MTSSIKSTCNQGIGIAPCGLGVSLCSTVYCGRYRDLVFRVLLVLSAVFPALAFAETLHEPDLVGTWVPSGEMPREGGVANYTLTVGHDFSATYISADKGYELSCDYKPSSSQDSIFVWYCYFKGHHLITLSLGGWKLESGSLLYGYEYWLGYPEPGEIHGGLPVSLELESS